MSLAAFLIGFLFFGSCQRASPPSLGKIPEFKATAVTVQRVGPLGGGELLGEPWIGSFLFTSCRGPCLMLAGHLSRLQEQLPASVRLVTFSVDPERDTPKELQDYARRFKADPARWIFLRLDRKNLYSLLRDGFKLALAKNPDAPAGFEFTHSTKFVLVDGQGFIRGYYDSENPKDLKRLIRHTEVLGARH